MVDPLPPSETPIDSTPSALTSQRPPVAPRSALRPGPRQVAIVVALALAAAVLLSWLDARHSIQALRIDAAQRFTAAEATSTIVGKTQSQLAAELRDAHAKIALLESRVAESQAQQTALEALYRDLAPSRDDIALAEIEQVLLIATQQLQLAGNVASALTALQLADAKLQRLDRPQFLPLRRAVARDIDALKAIPYVDVAGLAVKLDAAIAAVDALSLARDERIPPPQEPAVPADEPGWKRLLRSAWADVRQLVRIEVSDRPAAPLVPPAQSYFLRENLRLRLLCARIALLSREDASYRADVAAADNWLRQYFDLRAKPVQAVQATLKQAAAAPAPSATPDLGRSLEALRVLKLAQERAPGRAPTR
jgi:uroporphyrin-3 C-methyltransferase